MTSSSLFGIDAIALHRQIFGDVATGRLRLFASTVATPSPAPMSSNPFKPSQLASNPFTESAVQIQLLLDTLAVGIRQANRPFDSDRVLPEGEFLSSYYYCDIPPPTDPTDIQIGSYAFLQRGDLQLRGVLIKASPWQSGRWSCYIDTTRDVPFEFSQIGV